MMQRLLSIPRMLASAAFSFLAKRRLPPSLPANQVWPYGQAIVVPGTTVLCNSFYLVLYDEKNMRTILSAEVTQPPHDHVERDDAFCSDPRLKRSPTPDDYTDSGYDRGHLTPAADAGNEVQMRDTFLITNVVPQAPKLNRVLWKELEVMVRGMETEYVVTGAIYKDDCKRIGDHGIPVPDKLYKIVFLKDKHIECWITENTDDAIPKRIELHDLQIMLDFKFPPEFFPT